MQEIFPPPITLGMNIADTTAVAAWLVEARGTDRAAAVRRQLWLRAVLLEARARLPRNEWSRFARRADEVLALCGLDVVVVSEAMTGR
jgi:hypothetical protein